MENLISTLTCSFELLISEDHASYLGLLNLSFSEPNPVTLSFTRTLFFSSPLPLLLCIIWHLSSLPFSFLPSLPLNAPMQPLYRSRSKIGASPIRQSCQTAPSPSQQSPSSGRRVQKKTQADNLSWTDPRLAPGPCSLIDACERWPNFLMA